MPELMNTREVARYLGINEKKVYFLAKTGKIPCTRVTGKWTFPKKLIDQWIERERYARYWNERQSRRARLFAGGGQR
jgi:putative molybdopterin biosynthesis protein